jgi:hypothetical protein
MKILVVGDTALIALAAAVLGAMRPLALATCSGECVSLLDQEAARLI